MKKASAPKNASQKTKKANTNSILLTQRMERLLLALLDEPQTITSLQKKIPANNVPEYVRQLRQRCGLSVPCRPVPFTTLDGRRSTYGLYTLSETDRRRALKLIGS